MSDTRGVIDEDDSVSKINALNMINIDWFVFKIWWKNNREKKINIYMKDSGNKSSTNIVQIVVNSTLELAFGN
jgi:hypothetical protein